jgi:glycerol uptake facilitator-like aquaporin
MTQSSHAQKLAAETMGSLLLVAAVVGSGIMAVKLSAGNMAIALLGNTISTGAILVVLITILGPISSAHFNPAVSLVFALRREITWPVMVEYICAQTIGGCAGAALANAMFGLDLIQTATTLRGGHNQWLSEATATFVLIGTILGGLRFAPHAIPWLVGLVITSAYWFTASTSFANPAVTLARSLSDSFAGIALISVPGFVAAQLMGALLGLGVWGWLFKQKSGE